MEQLKEKVEIIETISETSTNDCTSIGSAEQLEQNEEAKEEKTLSLSEREQKRLDAKVSLMHKRWEGELESIYSEKDQILLDDETLVDYSAMVQEKAAIAQEQITKSIRESLALIRKYYETLNQFDNHMVQMLQKEEERLIEESKAKLSKKKGELPKMNKRKTREAALDLAGS